MSNPHAPGVVVDRTSAIHYTWGNVCEGWRLLAGADLAVIEERVPAGAGEVRHVHRRARQFFYVLEGQARMEFDGRAVQLHVGQGVEVSPGVPHRFANDGAVDVRFLVISSPSTAGDREDL
ncbi:MAG TPA: cupin domain-containing protein [Luteitalea sp.]|nr:cupin domain-containing protein [Luteitalea sp.]